MHGLEVSSGIIGLMWIDTHCHLDAPEFAGDIADVRARAAEAGVVHCVVPAVEAGNFAAVRDLAHRHGDSYALGIHPLCTGRAREDDLELLDRALADARDDPRLVAVGEIGLDYFVPGLDPARQELFYQEQLSLARAPRPAGDPACAALGRPAAQALAARPG